MNSPVSLLTIFEPVIDAFRKKTRLFRKDGNNTCYKERSRLDYIRHIPSTEAVTLRLNRIEVAKPGGKSPHTELTGRVTSRALFPNMKLSHRFGSVSGCFEVAPGAFWPAKPAKGLPRVCSLHYLRPLTRVP